MKGYVKAGLFILVFAVVVVVVVCVSLYNAYPETVGEFFDVVLSKIKESF